MVKAVKQRPALLRRMRPTSQSSRPAPKKVLLPNTGGSAVLSYTLMVTNNGPTEARDVVVTDTMPRRGHGRYGHAFRRSLHQFRHVVHLRPRSARRRTGVTIGVQASITDYMGDGPFTNLATMSTSTPDGNGANNEASHVTEVERAALAATGTGAAAWLLPATALLLAGTLLVGAVKPKRRRDFRTA
ncbi:hypothetical protein DQ354_03645 [Arthrobacter sp. AQ5-06]|nr:hypothetical protein DQ354_03645 [Arthrobacter sp. AQ5-06]